MHEIRTAGPYGIICCDANIDSTDAIAVVSPVLPLLSAGGILIFTVKCPTKYVTRESLAQLEGGIYQGLVSESGRTRHWKSMSIHWLLANTDHERTLVAVAAQDGESPPTCGSINVLAEANTEVSSTLEEQSCAAPPR